LHTANPILVRGYSPFWANAENKRINLARRLEKQILFIYQASQAAASNILLIKRFVR